MYVCIYIHTFLCVCVHIYIHTHIHTHTIPAGEPHLSALEIQLKHKVTFDSLLVGGTGAKRGKEGGGGGRGAEGGSVRGAVSIDKIYITYK
jgi:hypothetical protein